MSDQRTPLPVPENVRLAEAGAARLGFHQSCSHAVGRLLRTLAGNAVEDTTVLEVGTGCGVGSAWLLAGLRKGSRLVSIDNDRQCQRAAAAALGADERSTLLVGDWREALGHGPFALAFVDVAEAKDSGADEVIEAMLPGGLLLLDDFTPGPLYQGKHDERWHRWMHHPGLLSCEILVEEDSAAILASRI